MVVGYVTWEPEATGELIDVSGTLQYNDGYATAAAHTIKVSLNPRCVNINGGQRDYINCPITTEIQVDVVNTAAEKAALLKKHGVIDVAVHRSVTKTKGK